MHSNIIAKHIPICAAYFFLQAAIIRCSPVDQRANVAHGNELSQKAHGFYPFRQKRSASSLDKPEIVYKEQEDVCPFFVDRPLTCNEHSEEKKCVCFEPNGNGEATTGQHCQASKFHIRKNEIQDHILTIGIGYPLPEQFIRDPDTMFSEDIELFTSIPRESVVIFRKGCNPQRNAFEFQFGLLKEANNGIRKYHNDRLRTIHPDIFTQNHMFMEENGLYIEYVEKADSLRPLYGEASA
ncbi:hypothetical protein DdX_12642 [Ditylenchus destructor]|uniref:Uncharacterized protein n=1 Tax=Ditylenchus destructor TaxID=166010 RepID=A0AAD4N018_9BILA|nr:hypothetical protein DdX_12642 [Ditylenchus destructor]